MTKYSQEPKMTFELLTKSTAYQLLLPLLSAVLAAALALIGPYFFLSCRPQNFPPGPPTIPLLGNAHLLPPLKAFVRWKEWAKKYGPIIGLKLGPLNAVVLNDWRDVEELLERRGSIYSSRPTSYIASHLVCPPEPDHVQLVLAPYGPAFRSLRRAAQTFLGTAKRLDDLSQVQNAEVTQAVADILSDPDNYNQHIRKLTTTIILATVYGCRPTSCKSPVIQGLYHTQERWTDLMSPGNAPPVDGLTFLQWIPEGLAWWKKEARLIREEQRERYFGLLDLANRRMQKEEKSTAGCYMEEMISDQARSGLSDAQIAYVGGVFLEAGSDTTMSSLLTFVLGMLHNPDALRKAQEEVDSVCGEKRTPGPADIGALSYVDACMNEVLRWRPVIAGGAPHMLTETDTYKGYVFPAGTMFFVNSWAIHHNEKEYDDPDKFDPDRWLGSRDGTKTGKSGNSDDDDDGDDDNDDDDLMTRRKSSYGFGAGRRICVGQKMAENSLRLAIAKLVWMFDIVRPDGVEEVHASVLSAYDGGLSISPKKHPVTFRPRSAKRVVVLQEEMESLRPWFEKFVAI